MARESQGLQILLIVFVMLAVVLGTSLYLEFKKVDEATRAVAVANLDKEKAVGEKKAVEDESKALKTLIGFPERSTEEIKKQFAADLQSYGEGNVDTQAGRSDAGAASYSHLLAGMRAVIEQRTSELIHCKDQAAEQQRQFKAHEAARDAVVAAINDAYKNLDELIKKIGDVYGKGQQATAAQVAELVRIANESKKMAIEALAKADAVAAAAKRELQKKDEEIARLKDTISHLASPGDYVLPGAITAASQQTKTVWFNRGSADGVQPQMNFVVCAAGATSQAKGVKKGTIEVTQVTGEHTAEAHILDDKIADPITTGDVVFPAKPASVAPKG